LIGRWTLGELKTIYQTGVDISNAVGGVDNMIKLFGNVDFEKKDMAYGGLGSVHHVDLNSDPSKWTQWTIAHELGHEFDALSGWRNSEELENFTGGHTNWCQGILVNLGVSNCTSYYEPGCNNAGYYYGDIPPKGADENFNRGEDFAESFAALIYPERALASKNRYSDNPFLYNLFNYSDYTTTLRGLWMKSLIDLSTR
jgi:hypothetical protein